MIGLTPRQRELLAYLKEREVCPSYQEMATALGGVAMSAVHRLIRQLEARGHIHRVPNQPRAIEVIQQPEPIPNPAPLPAPSRAVWIPLRGRINTNEDNWKRKTHAASSSLSGGVGAGDMLAAVPGRLLGRG